ncbi:hypothetical protein TNCV_3940481 [Trichonephila clavipes]|uniref:Uncharacterized protein n=1 Tax=Trichonephila clavipes TaxID=2585209 RepID=A0A8X6VVT2_TRICX|nr:hypothetical protein TNCV_3940481 [Trichonephila clavipes]
MGHLELKDSSGWHRSRIERIDVFPFFFLLMGHLDLKDSSGWHRSRIGELMLERIDVFPFFSPDGTFRVEGLQWMTSFKDWRELMCFVFSPDGTFRVEGLQWMASFKDWRELMCFRFSPDGHLELKNSSGWHRSRIGEN